MYNRSLMKDQRAPYKRILQLIFERTKKKTISTTTRRRHVTHLVRIICSSRDIMSIRFFKLYRGSFNLFHYLRRFLDTSVSKSQHTHRSADNQVECMHNNFFCNNACFLPASDAHTRDFHGIGNNYLLYTTRNISQVENHDKLCHYVYSSL